MYLLSNGSSVRTVKMDGRGAFTLRLRPGRYMLCATAKDGDLSEAAFTTFDLVTDAADITLAMAPTATVSGRLVTADGSPRPNALFQVAAVLTDGGKDIDPLRRDRVDVSAEGTFELRGLFGERAIQVIGVPDGWEVQRILRGKTAISALSMTLPPPSTTSSSSLPRNNCQGRAIPPPRTQIRQRGLSPEPSRDGDCPPGLGTVPGRPRPI